MSASRKLYLNLFGTDDELKRVAASLVSSTTTYNPDEEILPGIVTSRLPNIAPPCAIITAAGLDPRIHPSQFHKKRMEAITILFSDKMKLPFISLKLSVAVPRTAAELADNLSYLSWKSRGVKLDLGQWITQLSISFMDFVCLVDVRQVDLQSQADMAEFLTDIGYRLELHLDSNIAKQMSVASVVGHLGPNFNWHFLVQSGGKLAWPMGYGDIFQRYASSANDTTKPRFFTLVQLHCLRFNMSQELERIAPQLKISTKEWWAKLSTLLEAAQGARSGGIALEEYKTYIELTDSVARQLEITYPVSASGARIRL